MSDANGESPPDKRRVGPPKGADSKTSLPGDDELSLTASVAIPLQRLHWAQAHFDRATKPIPTYGSLAWETLPIDDEATRVASAILAAESEARRFDELELNLRREMAEERRQHLMREGEEYRHQAEAHRARFGNPPKGKSFAERRADQLAAAKPRPGDYQGGPVQWNGGSNA